MRLKILSFAFSLLLLGCAGGPEQRVDYVYISAPQVALRDRVAAVYNKVGFVKNGEKVQVLERSNNKRFLKVRTADNKEGWIEVRYTATQDVFDSFSKLARDHANSPVQAPAVTRRVANMRVQPARDAAALYQLTEGTKLELLERASTPRSGLKSLQKAEDKDEKDEVDDKAKAAENEESRSAPVPGSSKSASKTSSRLPAGDPNDPLEDWWLVRDDQKRVGWMLGRMIDVEVPLEVAQYAEGDRIVAAFVINEVTDEVEGAEKKVPQYALLMSVPKDGMPFDFNQVRIFTWNPKKDRYETAYRERFEGKLPFKVTREDFGKEGTLPVFIARAYTKDGGLEEKKYKMNGVIVRRVLPPSSAQQAANQKKKPQS